MNNMFTFFNTEMSQKSLADTTGKKPVLDDVPLPSAVSDKTKLTMANRQVAAFSLGKLITPDEGDGNL